MSNKTSAQILREWMDTLTESSVLISNVSEYWKLANTYNVTNLANAYPDKIKECKQLLLSMGFQFIGGFQDVLDINQIYQSKDYMVEIKHTDPNTYISRDEIGYSVRVRAHTKEDLAALQTTLIAKGIIFDHNTLQNRMFAANEKEHLLKVHDRAYYEGLKCIILDISEDRRYATIRIENGRTEKVFLSTVTHDNINHGLRPMFKGYQDDA